MIATAENKPLLAFDSVFPQRDELLDANLMAKNFASNLDERIDFCEIVRVKYRAKTSLRVLYRVKSGSDLFLITARLFADNRGREIFENSANRTAIFYDNILKAVFWKFPSDRKIKQLEILQSIPPELKKIGGEIWQKSELVGYAPEKCAIAQCLNQDREIFGYAKVFAGQEGSRGYLIYDSLFCQTQIKSRFRFPKVLHYSEFYQTFFIEAIVGKRLADLEAKNLPNAFRLFGEAIAQMHNTKPFNFLTEFARLSPKQFSPTLEIIKKTRPENAAQAENLAQKLTEKFEFAEQPKVTLHGDVHAKNAILRADGRLTLIDLDQTSFGNASADIGSFLAGLFYNECVGEISLKDRKTLSDKFLAGYAQVRRLPTEKSLNWHTAAAIFNERGRRAINRFRVKGLEHFAKILTTAETILAGGKI